MQKEINNLNKFIEEIKDKNKNLKIENIFLNYLCSNNNSNNNTNIKLDENKTE